MIPERIQQMTVAEYLAFEEGSEIKHEYIDGEIYPIDGRNTKTCRDYRQHQPASSDSA